MTWMMWLTTYAFGVLAFLAMGLVAMHQRAMDHEDWPGMTFVAVVWPISTVLVLLAWGFLVLNDLLTERK